VCRGRGTIMGNCCEEMGIEIIPAEEWQTTGTSSARGFPATLGWSAAGFEEPVGRRRHDRDGCCGLFLSADVGKFRLSALVLFLVFPLLFLLAFASVSFPPLISFRPVKSQNSMN
jgi:hypothetical protein